MEGYTSCLQQSNVYLNTTTLDDKQAIEEEKNRKIIFLKEIRGEVLLRIAILKKEMGQIDASMSMCNSIQSESFNDTIKANTLCLKVHNPIILTSFASFNDIDGDRGCCMRLNQSSQLLRLSIDLFYK